LLEQMKPRGGLLLDVGCGAGDFLTVMRDRPGWQVFGLEQNPTASRYARERRGLHVKHGEFPCPALRNGCYDGIKMWHVLEHVGSPPDVLAEARRLLKPDGVLVVGVPVADSLEARWFGPYWAGYDVPRHLVTFTRSSLMRLVRKAGF